MHQQIPQSRREFLASQALGIGGVALAWLLQDQNQSLAAPAKPQEMPAHRFAPRRPTFRPKPRR